MKPTIRFTLALLAALAIAGCSHSADTSTTGGADSSAAQPGSAGAMAQGGAARTHRLGRILKSLNLTPAQEDQIKTIMADARSKSAGADPQTKRDNFKAALAQVDQVLTPAQRTEFHAKIQAMRGRGQGMGQGQDQQQQQPATSQ